MKKAKKIFLVLVLACIGVGGYCAAPDMNTSAKVTIIKNCPNCKGSGKMEIKKTHGPCAGRGCAACDYKGYTATPVNCATCGGSGKVKEVR